MGTSMDLLKIIESMLPACEKCKSKKRIVVDYGSTIDHFCAICDFEKCLRGNKMDKKAKKMIKDTQKVVKEEKSFLKADKKRDKYVEKGKKAMKKGC
jgi:hypothetical protein